MHHALFIFTFFCCNFIWFHIFVAVLSFGQYLIFTCIVIWLSFGINGSYFVCSINGDYCDFIVFGDFCATEVLNSFVLDLCS